MLKLRSLLAIFVATLALFAFDGALAEPKKKTVICGKVPFKCCPGYKCYGRYVVCKRSRFLRHGRCVPCGGLGQHVCRGRKKCRRGLVVGFKRGKLICVRPIFCGRIGYPCCRGRRKCKHPYSVCKLIRRGKKCVKCGGLFEPCCKWRRCKNPYECRYKGGGFKCLGKRLSLKKKGTDGEPTVAQDGDDGGEDNGGDDNGGGDDGAGDDGGEENGGDDNGGGDDGAGEED